MWQQPAVAVNIYPQTTQVILERNVESGNLLVGYISVSVTRRTEISSLTVTLTGDQQLDIRQGEGPSATQYSLRNRCLDISHVLVDASSDGPAVDLARIQAHGAGEPGLACRAAGVVVMEPGEYRFAFEFAVPSEELPASVGSVLGGVRYVLGASVRRPGWLAGTVVAAPVGIDVVQAPSTYLGSPCMRAAAFGLFLGDAAPSLGALTTLPLVLDQQVSDSWRVSVYMVSRAMKLGVESRIQAYVTRVGCQKGIESSPHGLVHVVGISARLTEVIVHRVPGTPCLVRSRNVVARANASVVAALWAKSVGDLGVSEQLLDARTIDCLGESLDGLVLPGSAALGLTPVPRKTDGDGGGRAVACGVQPSSCSEVFSVSHDLDVVVDVRGVEKGKVCRVTLSSPVVVLPEALPPNTAASALPSYAEVSKDLVLASSLIDCFCAPDNILCPSSSSSSSLPPPPTYV
ncbi:hypothetical protein LPJ56_000752 [Coemansia sp. RSA 2599]|nr:hypothetical protein LPJ75_000328 [Coemansia sp. RSA 2598]KAJ1828962.1 hypothetical protein LPJ56_000752 [Coemansia sp. RSA 2599]